MDLVHQADSSGVQRAAPRFGEKFQESGPRISAKEFGQRERERDGWDTHAVPSMSMRWDRNLILTDCKAGECRCRCTALSLSDKRKGGTRRLTENLSLNRAMSSIISFMPCSRQLTRCSYASWYNLGKTSLCRCSIGGPGTVKREVMAVSARWIGSRNCAGSSIRCVVFVVDDDTERLEEGLPWRWWWCRS